MRARFSAVGRSAIAVSPSPPKQEQQSQGQSRAPQEGEAAQTSEKAEASGEAIAVDSSQTKQGDSTNTSQAQAQESGEQASEQTVVQEQSRSEDSSVPPDQVRADAMKASASSLEMPEMIHKDGQAPADCCHSEQFCVADSETATHDASALRAEAQT